MAVVTLLEYRVLFSGRVQGVGFRFTARALARQFKHLTGYVRNLPDGRVEVLAEADEATFRDYMRSLTASPICRGVTDTHVEMRPLGERRLFSFDIHA